MEPKIFQIEDYFINLSNLLWAKRSIHTTNPPVNRIDLLFNSSETPLTFYDMEALEVICILNLMAKKETDKL